MCTLDDLFRTDWKEKPDRDERESAIQAFRLSGSIGEHFLVLSAAESGKLKGILAEKISNAISMEYWKMNNIATPSPVWSLNQ